MTAGYLGPAAAKHTQMINPLPGAWHLVLGVCVICNYGAMHYG